MAVKSRNRLLMVMAVTVTVLLMLLCHIGTEVNAAPVTGTCGENATWSLDRATGEFIISGTGATYDYTNTNTPWNSMKTYIKTVVVNDGITRIGAYTFYGCTAIKGVQFSNGITEIGDSAFFNCRGLTVIELPDKLTTIDNSGFSGCSSLTSIVIGENVTKINTRAFYSCSKLTSVTFKVTDGWWVFTNVAMTGGIGLESDALCDPSTAATYLKAQHATKYWSRSVEAISKGNCGADGANLTYVITGDGALIITGSGDMADYTCSFNSNTGKYESNAPWAKRLNYVKTVEINGNVTSIGAHAFVGCDMLIDLLLPDSVLRIGDGAFMDCDGLSRVHLNPTVSDIGNGVFACCDNLMEINMPDGTAYASFNGDLYTADYTVLVQYATGKPEYAFTPPETVTSINPLAFYGSRQIAEINIPQSVCSIGERAFDNCVALMTFTVSAYNDTYRSIDGNLYTKDGKKLISYTMGNTAEVFTVPNGVEAIGAYAFADCNNLLSVELPNTVRVIAPYAFYSCDNLVAVTVSDTYGWWLGADSEATEGLEVDKAWLEDPAVTANLLKSDYIEYYWNYNAHTHDYSVTVIAPTCTEGGYTAYVCKCGESYVDDKKDALGHDYQEMATVPNCTEGGFTEYTCQVCGDTYTGNVIEPLGHDYYTIVTPPTCYDKGYTTYICNVCKEVVVADHIAPLNHKYDKVVTASTCTDKGYTVYTCVNCGYGYKSDYTPELNHSYEEVNYLPTCTEEGYVKHTCSRCGNTFKSGIVPMLPHNYGDDRICDDCGAEMSRVFEGECGEGLIWYVLEDGELYVEGEGAMNDFLADDGHFGNHIAIINKVTVLEGVTYVGAYAFSGIPRLAEITLPSTLRSVGEYAFAYNEQLTAVSFPEELTGIGAYAFHSTALQSAEFAKTKGWCAGAADVSADIRDAATAAEHLTLNYSSIAWVRNTGSSGGDNGDSDFEEEYGPVIADGSFVWRVTERGYLVITGKGAMPNYAIDEIPWAVYSDMITHVVIGEGITTIGRCAFYGCTAIVDVSLPSTLTEIKEYGFYGCKSLTDITIPANVNAIGKFAFRRAGIVSVTFEITYGWSVEEASFSATEIYGLGAGYLTKNYYKLDWVRDVNAEVEEVNPNFFAGGSCNVYTKWELSYIDEEKTQLKLTVSGNGAMPEYGTGAAPWYEYLDQIVEIEVKEGVTTIGRCAFYNLRYVTNVTLGDGLLQISDYAFNGCRGLTEIDIPDTVKIIGKDAFGKTGLAVIPTV